MELKKIKKGLELAHAEEIRKTTADIKGLDLSSVEKTWNGYKWRGKNGETVWTSNGLTEREKQKPIKEQKEKLLKKELKTIGKEHAKHFEQLAKLEVVEYMPKRLEMQIDWHSSRTWGGCPSAKLWANYCGYYECRAVGGCGYDKRSTAAADVLEQCVNLRAAAFAMLNTRTIKEIKTTFQKCVDWREFLGYGLHFGAVYCSFGAGCGMGSILEELEHLGYKVTARHEPYRGADFYQLELNPHSKEYKIITKTLKGGKQ